MTTQIRARTGRMSALATVMLAAVMVVGAAWTCSNQPMISDEARTIIKIMAGTSNGPIFDITDVL